MKKPSLRVGDRVYDRQKQISTVTRIDRGLVTMDVAPTVPVPLAYFVHLQGHWIFVGNVMTAGDAS